jgi:hypothetical protein
MRSQGLRRGLDFKCTLTSTIAAMTTNPTLPFHIEGSRRPRPPSARTLYCDGSHGADFRPHSDLELSHWVPNLTPARYKADTSTEICLRFVADPQRERGFELVVNNHVDVDGTLALFVLAHGEAALPHRERLRQAAEMGDFQAWGDEPAQRLYQALALHFNDPARDGEDPSDVCEGAFAIVRAALDGAALPQTDAGIAALARSLELIESGAVERVELAERLVHYRVPARLSAAGLQRCLAVPPFDADLGAPVLLLPQARARRDGQRMQLISVASGDGWYHDLLYPHYCWAETPHRWRPPGLVHDRRTNRHRLDHAPLNQAADALNAVERGAGRWLVATELSPFAALPGRGFPVVLSCMSGEASALSTLAPQALAGLVAPLVLA